MANPTESTYATIQEMRDALGKGEHHVLRVTQSGLNTFNAALANLRRKDEGWYAFQMKKRELSEAEKEYIIVNKQRARLFYEIGLVLAQTAVKGPRAKEMYNAPGFDKGHSQRRAPMTMKAVAEDFLGFEFEKRLAGCEYDTTILGQLITTGDEPYNHDNTIRNWMREAELSEEECAARWAQHEAQMANEETRRIFARQYIHRHITLLRQVENIPPVLRVPYTWLRWYTREELADIWNPGWKMWAQIDGTHANDGLEIVERA